MWIVPSLLYIIFYKILTTWVFQNKLGDTALHAAAWKGYSDIVELLLQKSECLILPHVWFHKRKLIWECPASHKKPESCRKLWLKSLSVRYPPPPVQFRVSGGWSLSQHHLVIKWFFYFFIFLMGSHNRMCHNVITTLSPFSFSYQQIVFCFRSKDRHPEQWEQIGRGHGHQRSVCLASQEETPEQ